MKRSNAAWPMALLLIVLLAQVSVLPDTLQLKPLGRILNAATLFAFTLIALFAMMQGRTLRAPLMVVAPCMLVLAGYSINIMRNIGPETLGYAGLLLPWCAVLSVPFMKSYDVERAWKLFHWFMVVFAVIALAEYAAVFSGVLGATTIETDRGPFLRGIFTIFHGLEDGTAYYRMYGVFMEPGTFAMLLMPAIAYCLVHRKHRELGMFVTCLTLTRSLGGFASLVLLVGIFIYWRTPTTGMRIAAVSLFTAAAALFLLQYFVAEYQEKQGSASVREDNVSLFLDNFGVIVRMYPFGLPLVGKSLSALQGTDVLYFGSNFAIYTAFVTGGVVACAGYLLLFVTSLLAALRYLTRVQPNRILAPAMISLCPLLIFVFQRQTIFDLALFAFLFATPIMLVVRNHALLRAEPSLGKMPDEILPRSSAIESPMGPSSPIAT